MAKTKTTKGKLQAYDQWTPEYTKSGKLTARSQKALDAIRQGAMGEQVLSSDLGDFVDIAGFAGLTTMFYYHINPALLEILQALARLPKMVSGIWDYNVSVLGGITGLTADRVIKISATSQEDADALGDQIVDEMLRAKKHSLANKKTQRAGWEAMIVKTEYELTRPIRAEDWPALRDNLVTLQKAVEDVTVVIARLEAEIAAGTVNEADVARIDWKLEGIKVGIAVGQAGGWMWFLKSYDFNKAVENITITG